MPITKTPVNNGVNVQALLDARVALTAEPDLADFQWRVSSVWINGTHSRSSLHGFTGLRGEQSHKTESHYDVDHPECFAVRGSRPHPDRVHPRRPGGLPHRRRRRRRADARHPAAFRNRHAGGRHERARRARRRP